MATDLDIPLDPLLTSLTKTFKYKVLYKLVNMSSLEDKDTLKTSKGSLLFEQDYYYIYIVLII